MTKGPSIIVITYKTYFEWGRGSEATKTIAGLKRWEIYDPSKILLSESSFFMQSMILSVVSDGVLK